MSLTRSSAEEECIRYADDIVLLAKSERASERLLESSTEYLEETLKLKVNRKKSRTVSVFAIRNFKYLGFCFGKNGKGIYVRVHGMHKRIHAGMAELLQHGRHEKEHRRPEWMGV